MIVRLLIVLVLVLLNGFFVGAEFALVRSRRTRLEAMTRSGDTKARLALRALNNLPRLLSATQVGVTLASLGLGWVAESAFGELFEHFIAYLPIAVEVSLRVTIGATIALIVVTYFHVVFGELTPKAAALNHPESLARWLAPPLIGFAWLMSPFTWVLSRSATLVLRGLGQRPIDAEEQVHSAEELRLLVEQSQEGGVLEQRDAALIEGVFEFSEKNAREVMTPRTDMVALDIESTLDEAVEIAEESGFSRFPVYEETIDHVVGLVLAKDLFRVLVHRPEQFSLGDIMRPVHVVPGTREVEEVLSDFKRLKEHMAVVLDEYGGTAGLVTMEDLLEEIVGEILDEYDEAVEPFARPSAGEVLVPGSTNIDELNERYALDVASEDYTTIGGWVFGVLGRLPVVGDRVTGGGAVFTVREMDGRRIETLAVDLHSAGDRRAVAREEEQ
ncbi:MAG: HlyC/CorC family transporter [Gemmatimonadaceae bacterium]|nr:HlyC/CorC family transporter [Gemmatimonadaceae bacterium]NUQ93678.1 HlyC/CorC family transporter [Gemmatimonadaceae bacterium]NUR19617.1 HlyC/CorC family transporter [Gemmatimonadaceae bacterium]